MFVVLGLMTFTRVGAQNSVRLVSPNGRARKAYHKRALYGWDENHFTPGEGPGAIHVVDGMRLGLRVCYEARFPEYFRELFRQQADLVGVSFADVRGTSNKYDVMRSHLVSRAAENGMYVLSANSCSSEQGAPTALIDPDGLVMEEAPRNQEALITGVIEKGDVPFGRRGRILHSNSLQTGSI
jgi:predicted amidohydrolase